MNHVIKLLTTELKKNHSLSNPYYPWANGQVEATNKILIVVIYKSCGVEGEDWEEKLPSILWAYHTTYKGEHRPNSIPTDVRTRSCGVS